MRIVFVGAGAVGGYFGARIAQAGHEVSFLLRPASARLLRSVGLRVSSPQGDIAIERPSVLLDPNGQPPADIAFFACKAEHLRAAATLASPYLGDGTVAIPLQNGVDAPETLAQVLGVERVLGGLSRIFAERERPGAIVHFGLMPSIAFGERAGGPSKRVADVADMLAGVNGMFVEASEDIWTDMWKKLLMVCSLGAVGAVARAPLGILLDVPETRALLESAAAEIAAAGRAHGAAIPRGFAVEQIGRYRGLPPDTTASMHRDLERGDPSELDGQLGAARRYAREGGVPTPVLDALMGALLPGELRSRGGLEFGRIVARPAG